MKYAELKTKFEDAMGGRHYEDEALFRKWLLMLLFEIHGDLDSMAVSSRRCADLLEAQVQKNK